MKCPVRLEQIMRDIVATFKHMYGVDFAPISISKETDSVLEKAVEWQFHL